MVEGFRYIHEKSFIDRYLLTLQNLSKEVCIVLVVEGRVSAEQDVGDHSDAPHVHRLAVRLLGEHLGRHVARRAARRGHHARLLHLGQPEVADHDLAVRVGAATTIKYLGNVLSEYLPLSFKSISRSSNMLLYVHYSQSCWIQMVIYNNTTLNCPAP